MFRHILNNLNDLFIISTLHLDSPREKVHGKQNGGEEKFILIYTFGRFHEVVTFPRRVNYM